MRVRSKRLVPVTVLLTTLVSFHAAAGDTSIEEGNALLAEGEYRKAWARFQEVAATQGTTAAALTGMARAAIPLGEYAVAAELAGQVAEGTKGVRERVDALTLLGRAHMEATFSSPEHVAAEESAGVGRFDRAVEQFEAAIETSAALASEATYWLALARLERGENEMAAVAAASYLQQRPDGPFAEAARSIQAAASGAQDGELAPPTQKSKFRPDYAGKARKQGVCGMVIAQGVVDANGHYNDVVLLKGIEPVQDERLLEQISRSRFEPATADGTPTSTYQRYYLPIQGRGSDPARQIIPVE